MNQPPWMAERCVEKDGRESNFYDSYQPHTRRLAISCRRGAQRPWTARTEARGSGIGRQCDGRGAAHRSSPVQLVLAWQSMRIIARLDSWQHVKRRPSFGGNAHGAADGDPALIRTISNGAPWAIQSCYIISKWNRASPSRSDQRASDGLAGLCGFMQEAGGVRDAAVCDGWVMDKAVPSLRSCAVHRKASVRSARSRSGHR